MADETPPADPYDVVLADLRAKRDQIDQAIAALMALKGQGAQQMQGVTPSGSSTASTGVTPGMFHGMNIADAAKQVLALRKAPIGTQEITEALQSGGVMFSTGTPANTVGSVLHRQTKIASDIISVGRGKWALASWYPNPSRFSKKKGAEKSGDAPSETPPAATSEEEADPK